MNKGLLINAALYGILGFLLAIGGITVLAQPLLFILIIVLAVVIENVGRWDEISRRYRG